MCHRATDRKRPLFVPRTCHTASVRAVTDSLTVVAGAELAALLYKAAPLRGTAIDPGSHSQGFGAGEKTGEDRQTWTISSTHDRPTPEELSGMMTGALITLAAAAALLSLLSLAFDLAGRPWRRTTRLRSVGGLLVSAGVLSGQILLPASVPWAAGLIIPFLLVLAGLACLVKASKVKPPPAVRSRTTGQSGS